ncbi:MAG: SprT family zinc-dependent metalloprotease, partial [Chromatiales bacterium]
FAQRKRAWIERARADVLERIGRREAAWGVLPESLPLRALGETWQVRIVHDLAPGCLEPSRGHRLKMGACGIDQGLASLRDWVRHRAGSTLPSWLERVSRETGLAYSRAQVRLQRSRWGSCSSTGTISLNAKLLFLDRDLVSYLMVHELCHTRWMSHSPAFWRLVERKMPGYRELDASLRRASEEVPPWVHPPRIRVPA